jgi:plasmid stabilization system protein ParE
MDLLQRLREWFSTCETGTTVENIRDAITYTRRVMTVAERDMQFRRINPNFMRVFTQARQALTSISDGIERAENICQTLQAIRNIQNAIEILSQRDIIARDPRAATRAFAQLFQGFAQLASYLPPPFDMYNPILEGLGGEFFANVRAGIDPNVRPRDQRAMREMREAEGANVRGLQR